MSNLKLKEEKTLLLIKPDGVKRGLAGETLHRMEQRGLKIIAVKMVQPSKKMADEHYPETDEWLKSVGGKTLDNYQEYGLDTIKELGTDDALEIGKMIKKWNTDFLTSGPIIAAVISGVHAVKMVRKIVGGTLPSISDVGTIRGDYSVDSAIAANADKRAIHNVVHASGNEEEAEQEIAHWFKPEEIFPYKRAEEDIMF